jgi:hypothetical protein
MQSVHLAHAIIIYTVALKGWLLTEWKHWGLDKSVLLMIGNLQEVLILLVMFIVKKGALV